jgi:arylsulfatase A-like enzyme
MDLEDVQPGEQESLRKYWTAIYDASIRRADGAIGRILRHLQDQDTTRGMLVVLTADHGDEFLEHGGTLHKGTLFEEIVHVPLLIRVPGGPRGLRRKELVRSFDLTPTILDYAGVPTAARHMDAVSLRPALEGRSFEGPGDVYAGFPSKRMLRTDRYKLLRYRDGTEALYDLHRDPGEQHDIAGDGDETSQRAHATLAKRLDQIVETLRTEGTSQSGAPAGDRIDDRTREQLRALGYIE